VRSYYLEMYMEIRAGSGNLVNLKFLVAIIIDIDIKKEDSI
jgi:hypothetical protein